MLMNFRCVLTEPKRKRIPFFLEPSLKAPPGLKKKKKNGCEKGSYNSVCSFQLEPSPCFLSELVTAHYVEVSLFLQEGIQHSDGRIKLPSTQIGEGALGAPGAIKLNGAAQPTQALAFGLKSQPGRAVQA